MLEQRISDSQAYDSGLNARSIDDEMNWSSSAASAHELDDLPGELSWEDDEDDEDELFEEPFSLLANVADSSLALRRQTHGQRRVPQLIVYREGEVLDLRGPDKAGVIRVGSSAQVLISQHKHGALLWLRPGDRGQLMLRGRRFSVERALRLGRPELVRGEELVALPFGEGDAAQVVRGEVGYLLRWVYAPLVPAPSWRVRLGHGALFALAASVAFHCVALVGVALAMPQQDLIVEQDAEPRRVHVRLAKPELEPKPEPPKQEMPTPKAQPSKVTPIKRVTRPIKRSPIRVRPSKAPSRHGGGARGATRRLLAALSHSGIGSPGRSSLASLTGIRAIRSPSGRAGFRVAGLIGRTPRLRLGGDGGPGLKTKGKVGPVALLTAIKGTGRRGPRGGFRRGAPKVYRAPHKLIGCLSRRSVLSVVSRKMSKVQRCYEKALLTSTGLAGKAVFDWTIGRSGAVTSARLRYTSLRSSAVTHCILREIRRWRFPKPGCRGGTVKVRFPFVFRQTGFR